MDYDQRRKDLEHKLKELKQERIVEIGQIFSKLGGLNLDNSRIAEAVQKMLQEDKETLHPRQGGSKTNDQGSAEHQQVDGAKKQS